MFNVYSRYFYKKLLYLMLIILINSSYSYSQKIRVLPLGDSITDGDGTALSDSMETGYRQHLWLLLKSEGYPVDFVGSYSLGYSATPEFDPDNAGFGGYSTKQLLHVLKTGYGRYGEVITPGPYLNYFPADIILLHIGTNQLDTTSSDVEALLNYIDDYQDSTNTEIWVILSRIINEVPYNPKTSIFNNNVEKMVKRRIKKGDKIKMVDMENGAGLIYKIDTTAPYINGDMYDQLHPNESGYIKMANLFYDTLKVLLNKIIPVELAGASFFINKNRVILFWQTTMELSNYGFKVEKFSKNNGWRDLGFIKGAKDSHKLRTYYFVDSTLKNFTGKYNIEQIENNKDSKVLTRIDITNKKPVQYSNIFSHQPFTKYDMQDESRVNWDGFHLLKQDYSFREKKLTALDLSKPKSKLKKMMSGLFFYIMNTGLIDDQSLLYFSKTLINPK